jgi:7-alpha-hydroxysteroid dehydrogenase
MEEMNMLKGKIALVTGGGRGIGAACAVALAEAGADVAVCSRSSAEINAVAEKIRAIGRREHRRQDGNAGDRGAKSA